MGSRKADQVRLSSYLLPSPEADSSRFGSRSYFTSDHFPYSKDIFVKASKALDVEFVGAVRLSPRSSVRAFDATDPLHLLSQWNDSPDNENLPVPGVTRLGGNHQLNETEFDKQLTGSLASVGLRCVVFFSSPLSPSAR